MRIIWFRWSLIKWLPWLNNGIYSSSVPKEPQRWTIPNLLVCYLWLLVSHRLCQHTWQAQGFIPVRGAWMSIRINFRQNRVELGSCLLPTEQKSSHLHLVCQTFSAPCKIHNLYFLQIAALLEIGRAHV